MVSANDTLDAAATIKRMPPAMYIGQWGADYWDPHSNADTFTRNPDNADDAKAKPLAWRNAWAIPELTKQSDAAVLERDAGRRKKMYEDLQAEFRKTSPFIMVMQRGRTVEMLPSADLAARQVTNAYTLSLMEASTGFKRRVAANTAV